MTKPLRVLALIEATSISGTARAVLEMAYEAAADVSGQRRIEVVVATFARGEECKANALTKALALSRTPVSFIIEKHRFDLSVVPQIRRLIVQNNIDVVWTNSVKSHFLVYLAGVKKRCAWVAFHHGYTSTDLKMLVYNQLDRVSLRHANRVLTVCLPLAEQMRARGVEDGRIRVQHMPIRAFSVLPDAAAALRAELGLRPEAKVILCVGRMSREKAHADLIAAFVELRELMGDDMLRLVLVGDGAERRKLERKALLGGVREQIIFVGHRDDARQFYGIADVFALPSHAEGTPNVMLESMSARVPVVATWVGGIPELASNGKNALIVAPGKPHELAMALEKVLRSTQLRSELSMAAGKVVASHPPRLYFENMRRVFLEAAADWRGVPADHFDTAPMTIGHG